MIIFESLLWDGYFTWRRGKLTKLLLEDQGLVQIKGGNGTGKSSIFNTFAHILYGQTPNKKSKGASITAEGGLHGIVNFRKEGGCRYRIEQTRKGKTSPKLIIYEDGVDVTPKKERYADIHKHVTEEIIGMSFQQFVNTVYIPQRSTHLLIHSEPKARREFLSGLFGIDSIDDVIDVLSSRKKDLSESLKDLDSEESTLLILKEEFAKLPKLEKVEATVKKLKKKRKRLRDEFDSVQEELSDMKEELKDAKWSVELKERLEGVDVTTVDDEFKRTRRKLDKTRVLKGEAKAAQRVKDKHVRLTSELSELSEVFMTSDALRKNIKTKNGLLVKQELQLKQTKKVLKVEGDCPTCLQPVSDEYLDSLEKRAKDLSQGRKSLLSELETYEDALDTSKQRDRVQQQIDDLGKVPGKKHDLASVTQKEQKLSERLESMRDAVDDAKELGNLGKLRSIKKCKRVIKKLELLKAELEDALDETSSKLGALERDIDDIVDRARKIKRMKKSIKRGGSSRDKSSILSSLHEALVIRKMQWLNQAVEALADRLPYHLDVLFPEPGILFDLKCTNRSFMFEVDRFMNRRDATKGKERYDVSCFSGGEEARLSLGLQLAIHDISSVVATNLIILDEPDKHLDDEGKEGFATKLTELRGMKGTVLVTSHGPGLSESDLYDKALQVKMRKASSVLKVIR